ncbi:MAG: HEPN domain-containing protein [Deltaproteobacteria bacterium]|nr:MAG: HEPN domain-containing protein [Deltaproteobacteria bacterium]
MNDAATEARRWLAAARDDLEFSRHAAAGGYHAPACFYAQQSAEKAVKALHFARGARAVIGHNIRSLIERLDPREPRLDRLVDDARELDLFYIPARYPNGLETGTPGEAFSAAQSKRAIELATRFVETADALLGH